MKYSNIFLIILFSTVPHILSFSTVHAQSLVTVYRFFNKTNGAYLYTTNENERDSVLQLTDQWMYEGSKFQVAPSSESGMIPVYRFFNNQKGGHLFITNETEFDSVSQLSEYSFEGIAFYVFENSSGSFTESVSRYFDTITGIHLFTASTSEKDSLNILSKFNNEGITFYVFPLNNSEDLADELINEIEENSDFDEYGLTQEESDEIDDLLTEIEELL